MVSRGIDSVRAELDHIVSLGIAAVRVSDENVTCNKARLYAICTLMKERGLLWRCSSRTNPNSTEMYSRMRASGCVEVSIGVETADQHVLDLLRKRQTVAIAGRAVDNAVSSGISSVRALMMAATPGEVPNTQTLNMAWAADHPAATVCLTGFVPFPGTAIYRHPDAYGCRLYFDGDMNLWSVRGDASLPEARISIIGGMTREELTESWRNQIAYLDSRGQLNHG